MHVTLWAIEYWAGPDGGGHAGNKDTAFFLFGWVASRYYWSLGHRARRMLKIRVRVL